MTGQQLKNSILQMAVQGKLVPQDPDDEPASVLLERIRKEKERLVREKKIKLEKNPSVIFRGADNLPYEKRGKEVRCIADEIPFEIPDSWEWARLCSLAEPIDNAFADGPFGSNLKSEHYTLNREVRIIQLSNIGEDGWRNENTKYTTRVHANLLQRSCVNVGDIVIAKMMPAGRAIIVPDVENAYILSSDAVKFVPNHILNKEYLVFAINSPMFREQVNAEAHGITRIRTSLNDLKYFLLPIPPIEEQVKIVAKIKTTLKLVFSYAIKEQHREKFMSDFPILLKKSILQEAIQGKLVPQDPNDEPACVLLERIHKEKARLVKEGKLKPDKHESVIFRRDNSHYEKRDGKETCIDDEIPFEIPASWAWTRASSLGTMVRGRGIMRNETTNEGQPCIRYGEIYTSYNETFKTTKSFITTDLDKRCLHLSNGDIVFTLTGENKVDIAKAVAFMGEGKVAAGGDLAYWTEHGMNPLYIVFYMASPFCVEQKRNTATGDIIVHISTTKVGEFLLPVPPLQEQSRIVDAIQTIFSQIATL